MRKLPALIWLSFGCSEYEFSGKTAADEGAGSVPEIEVDPEYIDFGTHPIATSPSQSRVITVRNIGTRDLLVEDVLLDDPGGPFSITVLSGLTLEPEQETTFIATWEPEELGVDMGQTHVYSTDPDRPIVAVELVGKTQDTDTTAPDIVLNPSHHDFGVLDTGTTSTVTIEVHNAGDADLTVHSATFDAASSDMRFDASIAINGSFPWTISPGATLQTYVDYTPEDALLDSGTLTFESNDPDTPEAIATQVGNGRPFDGFSTGWYIYDDAIPYETTSSPSHVVDSHGDHDLYWYEVSGAHGLVDSSDPDADFEILRDYVIDRAGSPSVISGPLTFSSVSTLATFEYATYTYILCDFWIDAADDPAQYEVSSGSVDDGIQVMVNAEILGHMGLGEASRSWSLASVGRPGEVNTLVVILVDDSAVNRYLTDLAFYKDGVMVE